MMKRKRIAEAQTASYLKQGKFLKLCSRERFTLLDQNRRFRPRVKGPKKNFDHKICSGRQLKEARLQGERD